MSIKDYLVPAFPKVFRCVDGVCLSLGIRVYLIGAQARDIQLLQHGLHPARRTEDIDFAVMLPSHESFEDFKAELERRGFKLTQAPYRLVHVESDTIVDFLPFGEIQSDDVVRFSEYDIELSVVGMAEVLESTEVLEIEGNDIRVASLAGLVMLKLLAFHERSDRTKDLEDIKQILLSYFEIYQARFYEKHRDTLDEISDVYFDIEAGARLLGRDIRQIIGDNQAVKYRLLQLLEIELGGGLGPMSKYYLSRQEDRRFAQEDVVKKVFELMHNGLME